MLNAIDLNTGKIAWQVPLGEHEELSKRGVKATGTENFGGPLVTAGGLVFCAGTRDLKLRAFDKATGEDLVADLPSVVSRHRRRIREREVVRRHRCYGGGKLAVPPLRGTDRKLASIVAFALPERTEGG